VPRITDFCSCIYVLGCKLSLVRLCDSDFGITPVDDITIGITCAAFCFHIAHISFPSSWYLFCLSVIVLARLCVFGTAMSIEKVFFVFLFTKGMSSRLKGIVLSVSMLRFQYSLLLLLLSLLKQTRCNISQVYFDKELYMFRTDLLSIISSLNTAYTAIGICHASCVDCLLAGSRPDLASRQSTQLA